MANPNEIQTFLKTWEYESQGVIRVLESIPDDKYDFRPDPNGRSIGEMAWHLSESDGYMSMGIAGRQVGFKDALPELKRPKEVKLLAPGYRRVHELAVERLRNLKTEELDENVKFPDGTSLTVREMLWGAMLHHLIHHRAQLVLLCRLAGGTPPGLYGPNREEMQALREKMAAKA